MPKSTSSTAPRNKAGARNSRAAAPSSGVKKLLRGFASFVQVVPASRRSSRAKIYHSPDFLSFALFFPACKANMHILLYANTVSLA
jgi:hypothetical protein